MQGIRISKFILDNLESLLEEWEEFARPLPSGSALGVAALRGDAEQMLLFIAADLETSQTAREQSKKAKGRRAKKAIPASAARRHGLHRLEEGFDIVQMVSEYRALRARVTRLWIAAGGASAASVQDLVRFNEAIDQVLAEAMERFSGQLERSRGLLMAIVGHDLRNPLNTIRGSWELLRSEPLQGAAWQVVE